MFYIKSSLKTDEQQEEQKSPTTYSIYVLSGKKMHLVAHLKLL